MLEFILNIFYLNSSYIILNFAHNKAFDSLIIKLGMQCLSNNLLK